MTDPERITALEHEIDVKDRALEIARNQTKDAFERISKGHDEKLALEQRVLELGRERDELQYRLRAWDDSHSERCAIQDKQLADLQREAEGLRRDKDRLDWLASKPRFQRTLKVHPNGHVEINPDGELCDWKVGNTLREAVDAATAGSAGVDAQKEKP